MIKHEENVNKKLKLVTEVRSLKKIGLSNREISRRIGITTTTIRKYLDENFTPIHASYGKKKSGKLIPYIKKIDACLEKGMMGSLIEKEIRGDGYKGSSSTIRHYITDWKRRRKKVKTISHNQYEQICKECPCFQNMHTIVWKFKELLRNKNIGGLNDWIKKARNLEIGEIESFINGLEQDIDAVKNAIKYEYNNGLAEGSVNKLKVIKRIMYGRCGFDTLRFKTLRLEKMRKIN